MNIFMTLYKYTTKGKINEIFQENKCFTRSDISLIKLCGTFYLYTGSCGNSFLNNFKFLIGKEILIGKESLN